MKHVQVRLEDDEYNAFRDKARQAGFDSVQEAGKQLILSADWREDKDRIGVPPRRKALLEKTTKLLASCDDSRAEAVETIVDAMLLAQQRKGHE